MQARENENGTKADQTPLMPHDGKAGAVLRERAAFWALPKKNTTEARLELYVHFRLGDGQFGLPYHQVNEVLPSFQLSKVPCTPSFIAGIVNQHGNFLTVIDLKQFFRTPSGPYPETASIIVASGGAITAGLLADEIYGNAEYDPGALGAPLAASGVSNPQYVLGTHNGTVTLLDADALLGDSALVVDKAAGTTQYIKEE